MDNSKVIIGALVYIFVVVVVYGKILDKLAFSKTIDNLGNCLMGYFKASKYSIKVVCCWMIYLLTGIIFAIGAGVLFGNYFTLYSFRFGIGDVPILLLGFIGQSSLSCLALLLVKTVVPSLQWDKIIGDVEWVKASRKFPTIIRVIYPMSSSFVEELLFRGVLYCLLRSLFIDSSLLVPILIISVAFSVEQILNTQTLAQAIGLMVGSLCISTIGCLMIEATGSITPAILSHMLFAVFYTRGYKM